MNETLNVEQALQQNGVFVSTTSGISMEPLFRNRRDTIVVTKPNGRLKKYDVPLYRRGDEYVLHRIVKVLPDGYVICGDNCITKEYGVTDADIVGVLTEFYRKEKHYTVADVRYRAYTRLRVATHPLRVLRRRLRHVLSRLIKHKKP